MIDTHCHLTFKEFAGRTATILSEARQVGVRGAITVATTSADCLRASALAEAHPGLWCSAGVHPLHSDEALDWAEMERAAASSKCVAWGELGLDHHYDHPPRSTQRKVLEEQLAFIQRLEDGKSKNTGSARPLIVHCRNAFDDLLAIFGQASFDHSRYVFHCFTGNADDARKVLDFGASISFTGIVTFQNAQEVAAAARIVPEDRIMVETDSPYLTPEPMRKLRPNEPKFVIYIARKLAALRGVDETEFENSLDRNAERIFGIELPK